MLLQSVGPGLKSSHFKVYRCVCLCVKDITVAGTQCAYKRVWLDRSSCVLYVIQTACICIGDWILITDLSVDLHCRLRVQQTYRDIWLSDQWGHREPTCIASVVFVGVLVQFSAVWRWQLDLPVTVMTVCVWTDDACQDSIRSDAENNSSLGKAGNGRGANISYFECPPLHTLNFTPPVCVMLSLLLAMPAYSRLD